MSVSVLQVRSSNNTCQGTIQNIFILQETSAGILRDDLLYGSFGKLSSYSGKFLIKQKLGVFSVHSQTHPSSSSPDQDGSSLHAAIPLPLASPLASPVGKQVKQTSAHWFLLSGRSTHICETSRASLSSAFDSCSLAQKVKNPPVMQETQVRSLGQEDPLEKGMAADSRILAWRIPWTEEPGGSQSMGSWRVGHN